MRSIRRVGTTLTGLALTLAAGVAFASPAMAATPIVLDCQAQAPILGPQQTTLNQTVDVTAPETVAPGAAFEVVIAPGPVTPPTTVNGIAVRSVKNLALKVPTPKNSTFVSAELSGPNAGNATLTPGEGFTTVKLAGPFPAGAPFELPVVTAQLKAGDTGTIETRLGGTSYTDPALTLTTTANVLGASVDAPTSCYPKPDAVFTTTTIS